VRKQVMRVPQIAEAWVQGWLDLNKAASVEVSSEDESYPIEAALLADEKRGWRARKSSVESSWPLRMTKLPACRSLF